MRRKEIILPKIYEPSDGSIKGWFIYFSIFDDFTGKMKRTRRYEGFTKCKSIDECRTNAQRLVDEYTQKLNNGWTPWKDKQVIWSDNLVYSDIAKQRKPLRRTKKTISYWCSLYLDTNKNTWAKGSFDHARSELRIFTEWLKRNKLNEIDVSEFTKINAHDFFAYLESDKDLDSKPKKPLRGATKNNYAITVRGVWKLMRIKHPLIPDPWSEIPKYAKKTIPQRPLKRGVISVLKTYFEKNDPQIWLACQFMYYCFVRPKEMRFMQIKHLDLFEGKITLFADITKGGKSRTVEIAAEFLELLWEKYELNKFPEDYYVFTAECKPGKKPISKNYFWNHFDKARKELNIPKDYKFYGWKHTGAVRAIKAGASIKDIQQQMGHSDIKITDEYLKSMSGYESEFFKKKMPGI
jgi:integrase